MNPDVPFRHFHDQLADLKRRGIVPIIDLARICALAAGHEGVMAKELTSTYDAGRRGAAREGRAREGP